MEHDCEDVATQNPVKVRLNNIAVGNPLTDDDHSALPLRCMKLIVSAGGAGHVAGTTPLFLAAAHVLCVFTQ